MRPTRPARNEEPETEEMEFDIENDLKIDPDFLDAEFLNHPVLFMKYAKASAKANKAAKQAEEKVKTVRSMLVKEATGTDAAKNATTLEAYYRLDPSYIAAKKAWVEATYEADCLVNAVFAMQARKSTLENLVRLHGQEYFSTPQEPRDLPEAAKRLTELKTNSVEKIVREATNRRRR